MKYVRCCLQGTVLSAIDGMSDKTWVQLVEIVRMGGRKIDTHGEVLSSQMSQNVGILELRY